MVDKLTRYEVKLLNKVIPKTTESASFNVFDILEQISRRDTIFDKGHYTYSDQDAERITNFLLDKKLVIQVHPDKPAFQQIVRWTDKGIRLKKYRYYHLYKFMADMRPEVAKLIGFILLVATLLGLFKLIK